MPGQLTYPNSDVEEHYQMREMISNRPGWVVRNGNAVLLVILCGVFGFTWFIRYPDVIKGSMKLVAVNAPKLLVAKSEGKLQKLLVNNESEVVAGQPLAYIESTGDHVQMLGLRAWILSMETFTSKDSLEAIFRYSLPVCNNLGEVQSDYQEFEGVFGETRQVLANGYYQQKRRALKQDMQYLSALSASRLRQQQLMQQDYELQQVEYNAEDSLARQKVIAPIELNQNKSKMIGKEQTLEQISAQVISDNLTEAGKMKEMLELQKTINDQRQKFKSSLFTLKSAVEKWLRQYVVTAPESGKVLFTSFLQENEQLSNGQEMFYIQPTETLYYGQMLASQAGLGKVRAGQKVMIRVESYPSQEYGYLAGKVSYIFNMPTAKDSFMIKVELLKGLVTNYNKVIFFRNNLDAEAEVMTDDKRLLDKIFARLIGIFKR
jgi:multidrug resistance efflux pump